MLKFFKLRDGLIRESITSTFLLEKQKGNPHLGVCLYFSYKGMLAKEIKTQSTTAATAQEEKIKFVSVFLSSVCFFYVHGGHASTSEIEADILTIDLCYRPSFFF